MSKSVKKIFPVTGLGCAACATRVENTVRAMAGVSEAAVNFASLELAVEFDPSVTSPEAIAEAVKQAGYGLIVEKASAGELEEIQKKSNRP